jgi:hypothetical protein
VKKCSHPQISKGEPTEIEFGIAGLPRMNNIMACHLMGHGGMKNLQGETNERTNFDIVFMDI